MKEIEKANKQRNRRQTLDRLSSGSGLLLFLLCFIALIHHQLRIQENHRLILDSSELFNKLETEIFRKIQQNDMKWRNKEEEPGVDGERLKVTWYFFVSLLDDACFDNSTNVYKVRLKDQQLFLLQSATIVSRKGDQDIVNCWCDTAVNTDAVYLCVPRKRLRGFLENVSKN